ncbi:MAG: YbaB/EbfC family nucleoid-associated protein [Candidatus Margulisbacteria bacterium]|nr:YbaB/EbfC family nucleoid-associated protein [Candidatus Margulisiibacteriota bacterium]
MFGNMGNMGDMMKQLGEMKKQMKELKKISVEVSSKDNEVTVVMTGEMKIKELKIAEGSDPRKIASVIKETVNKAFQEVTARSAGQFKGLNIPGLG